MDPTEVSLPVSTDPTPYSEVAVVVFSESEGGKDFVLGVLHPYAVLLSKERTR